MTNRATSASFAARNAMEILAAANPPPPSEAPVTFTLEPFCFDGVLGVWYAEFTRQQLGGTLTPYVKIPYVASGLGSDVREGAARIDEWMQRGSIQAGDTVEGFSLGAQTVMYYLSEYTPPPGVKFMLVGCTFTRNQEVLDYGSWFWGTGGVPWDIENEVTMIAREFDGYSDKPDVEDAEGYDLAQRIARDGRYVLHDYVTAQLANRANVVDMRGNITAILVPTQWLPDYASEDDYDAINGAYSGPRPTTAQRAAATEEQVE
jgi:hypothetical protein